MAPFPATSFAASPLLRRMTALLACCLLAASIEARADDTLLPYEVDEQTLADAPDTAWEPEPPPPPPGDVEMIAPYDSPYDGVYFPQPWDWVYLPEGLIYRSYLAGVKESRFGSTWFHEKDQGALWDIALGGRVGILRFGTDDPQHPEGWQLDIEGAAFPRLDTDPNRDLVSADFRFGIPLTYGEGPYQTKFAYYHLSSHLGDEFMLLNPSVVRINYTRDAFVWGHSVFWTDDLRLYGEVEWAFNTDGGAEPWAFQFGADYAPAGPTGFRGAPFAAVNVHLREEVEFGGHFTVQAGWQWRGSGSGKLMRIGMHYLNGKSPQFEFFDDFEEQIGGGIWYDY